MTQKSLSMLLNPVRSGKVILVISTAAPANSGISKVVLFGYQYKQSIN